jgi:YaiO family outer membrane protein
MPMHNKIILFGIFTLSYLAAIAQDWKQLGVDELFERARTEAFDGDRRLSQKMLLHILETSPDYADVRIMLGRTYAWDGYRKEAITEFEKVLQKDPDYKDALNALTDVYMWDDNYPQALEVANKALKYYPNFEDFLYKKADILNALERPNEAITLINQILIVNPGSERAISLRNKIKVSQQRYNAGLKGAFENYSIDGSDPAYYASASLGRTNNWGSSIARLNYANRFNYNGWQGEIDLYPRIVSGTYAYLSYGYSNTRLFPNHRAGAELFTTLPKSFEGSLGIRYMYFSSTSKVMIYTGSLGWYYKSWWLSVRPYITPDKNTGTSFSFTVTARRYFGNPDHYISLAGGLGYSPESILQSSAGFATDQIYTLKSQKFSIGYQKPLRYNLIALASFNLYHQELSYDVGNYMWITNIEAGLNYRF